MSNASGEISARKSIKQSRGSAVGKLALFNAPRDERANAAVRGNHTQFEIGAGPRSRLACFAKSFVVVRQREGRPRDFKT
jgi:hypothetical protein